MFKSLNIKTCEIAAYLIVILTGITLIILSTHNGIGLNIDSTIYLEGAKTYQNTGQIGQLIEDGSINIIDKFPPGFFLFLTLFDLGRLDFLVIVNVILYLLNSTLVYLLIANLSQRAAIRVLMFAAICLNSINLSFYTSLLSEPISLLFIYISSIFFIYFLKSNKKFDLITSIIFICIAILFRLSGAYFLLGILITSFVANFRSADKKFSILTISSVIAVGVITCLALYTLLPFFGRHMSFYGAFYLKDTTSAILNNFLLYFNPLIPNVILVKFISLILLITIIFSTKWHRLQLDWINPLTALFVSNIIFYSFHAYMIEDVITTEARTIYIPFLCFMMLTTHYLNISEDKSPSTIVWGILIVAISFNIRSLIKSTSQHFDSGIYLNAKKYKESFFIQSLDSLNNLPNVKIFTNERGPIVLYTKVHPGNIPVKVFHRSKLKNENLSDELNKIDSNTGNKFLLYFKDFESSRAEFSLSQAEINQYLKLTPIQEDDICVLYQLNDE
ncbi:MAG: hypothetical protein KDC49_12765 [Saprospiraceae bacterium]|nr:hypothetical protein [Saprospiraceae bacterium]